METHDSLSERARKAFCGAEGLIREKDYFELAQHLLYYRLSLEHECELMGMAAYLDADRAPDPSGASLAHGLRQEEPDG